MLPDGDSIPSSQHSSEAYKYLSNTAWLIRKKRDTATGCSLREAVSLPRTPVTAKKHQNRLCVIFRRFHSLSIEIRRYIRCHGVRICIHWGERWGRYHWVRRRGHCGGLQHVGWKVGFTGMKGRPPARRALPQGLCHGLHPPEGGGQGWQGLQTRGHRTHQVVSDPRIVIEAQVPAEKFLDQ